MKKLLIIASTTLSFFTLKSTDFDIENKLNDELDIDVYYYDGSIHEQKQSFVLKKAQKASFSTPGGYCVNNIWVKKHADSEGWLHASGSICLSGKIIVYWGNNQFTPFSGGPVAARDF